MKLHYFLLLACISCSTYSQGMEKVILEIPKNEIDDELKSVKLIAELLLQDMIDSNDQKESLEKKRQVMQLIGKLFEILEIAHERCLSLEKALAIYKTKGDRVVYREDRNESRVGGSHMLAFFLGISTEKALNWLLPDDPKGGQGDANGSAFDVKYA